MADLERETPLFDKFIPIQVIDEDNESRVSTLVFRIIAGTQPAQVVGQIEKIYHFEITDERDPYFLFNLDINEHSFHQIKRDQGILVELNVFPLKLMELLELCLLNPSNASTIQEGGFDSMNNFTSLSRKSQRIAPKLPAGSGSSFDNSVFSAKLDSNTGTLSIVESNMFKQITHIVLHFIQGNDEAIKLYLNSRLQFTLDFARSQAAEILQLSDRTADQSHETAAMSAELAALRSQWEVDLKTLRSEHSQQMSNAQMTSMAAMEEMRGKFEKQLAEVRQQLEELHKDTQHKIVTYDHQLADLTMEKNAVELQARDLNRSLQATEADRDRLLKECDAAVQERRLAENAKSQSERDIERLQSKIESLTQQVKDRDESMNKTNALHKASEDARASLEAQLQMYASNGEVMQDNLRSGAAEIERGNAIIAKLQSEMKQLREKVKLKSEVIRKQEAVVTELRMESHSVNKTISEHKDAERSAKDLCAALQKQLNEAQQRLKESNSVIENNQQVIKYLNDEMNKWQLGMRIDMDATAEMLSPAPVQQKTAAPGAVNRVTPSSSNVAASSSGYATKGYSAPSAGEGSAQNSSSEGDDSLLNNLGLGKNMEHVYMKGLKNLGLDAELSGEGMAAVLRDSSAYGVYEGAGKVTGAAGGAHSASYRHDNHKASVAAMNALLDGGVPLSDMEYYQISPSSTGAASSRRGDRGPSDSPPHKSTRQQEYHMNEFGKQDFFSGTAAGTRPAQGKYHWQSDDFGTSREGLPRNLSEY